MCLLKTYYTGFRNACQGLFSEGLYQSTVLFFGPADFRCRLSPAAPQARRVARSACPTVGMPQAKP